MPVLEQINVGIVGGVGRGGAFREAIEANGARIHAVCDIRAEKLDECMRTMNASEKYVEYAEMLDKSELDAIVIGTPMPFHAPQTIGALEKGLHPFELLYFQGKGGRGLRMGISGPGLNEENIPAGMFFHSP